MRANRTISALMLDLDHFNGSTTGVATKREEALAAVGVTLVHNLCESDFVARCGG